MATAMWPGQLRMRSMRAAGPSSWGTSVCSAARSCAVAGARRPRGGSAEPEDVSDVGDVDASLGLLEGGVDRGGGREHQQPEVTVERGGRCARRRVSAVVNTAVRTPTNRLSIPATSRQSRLTIPKPHARQFSARICLRLRPSASVSRILPSTLSCTISPTRCRLPVRTDGRDFTSSAGRMTSSTSPLATSQIVRRCVRS